MVVFTATTASTFLHLSAPGIASSTLALLKTRGLNNSQNQQSSSGPLRVSMQTQSFNAKRGHFKVAVSGSVTRLRPIERRINLNRKRSPIIYAAAMNARCAASGQTQTLTNKAPGVTKAPQRETNKTLRLDDGGHGFPPHSGGGGGGGGGGNFSGGFFLFGFLGFLGPSILYFNVLYSFLLSITTEILKLDSIVFNQMVAELLKKVLKRDVFSWNVCTAWLTIS
ncbi:hypothetical protein D5086_003251 [Populus alba]|uniref:Uncharacterized protein n=1 Tax=Populus alba TaxID=43335 RepID=A0ACC4D602_POPAL